MIRIAVLGDIGSGKSYVAKQFGYPVFNADSEVAKLYRKSRKCHKKLKKALPKYITSFLFKLKSKPAALYSALSGFAIQGVNLTKLQSYPEKNSFTSYFFLCDLDGHIDDQKVKKSLEELGLHCNDMHILGVYESDKFREK